MTSPSVARGSVGLAGIILLGCASRPAPVPTPPAPLPAEVAKPKPKEPDRSLDAAVAELRHVVPAKLREEDKERKSAAIEEAWRKLEADPARAVPALKAEYGRFTARGERDDYYVIEAGYLIYKMGGAPELPSLERMYSGLDVSANFHVVFETLLRVANSRDVRGNALLRRAFDFPPATATVSFPAHALTIEWPDSLSFMLAPMGARVCPLAADAARTGKGEGPLSGAFVLLLANVCPETPEILRRRLAAATTEGELAALVRALGTWAAPADRTLIEQHAADQRPLMRASALFALYEMGDPASNPILRRMIAEKDDDIRAEVIGALFHTLDLDNVRTVLRHLKKCSDRDREIVGNLVKRTAELAGVAPAPLMKGDEGKWKQAIAAYWKKWEARFDLGPGDRKLTHDQLLEAMAEWESTGRITDGNWAWVYSPQVLAVATAEDVPRLLAVRGQLFLRESDEMLYEVVIIDKLVEVLHRRQVGAPRPLISRFGTFE